MSEKANMVELRSKQVKNISLGGMVSRLRQHKSERAESEKNFIIPQRRELYKIILEKERKQVSSGQGMLLLHGPPGTGKTTIVKEYVKLNNKKLFTFQCHGGITLADLSKLAEAIKISNIVIFFDEYNTLPSVIRGSLHSLFDNRRELTVDGKTIKVAERIFFIGAQNPARIRNGVKALDMTEADRMSPLHITYPRIANWNKKGKITHMYADEVLMAKKNLRLFPEYTLEQFLGIWNAEFNKEKGQINISEKTRKQLHHIMEVLLIVADLRWKFKHHHDGRLSPTDIKVPYPFTLRDMQTVIHELMDDKHPLRLSEEEKRDGITLAKKAIIETWINKIRMEEGHISYPLWKMILKINNK